MHYEIEPHLTFHLAATLEWLYSRCYRLYQPLAMIQRVLPTTGLPHVREPAVCRVFSQGTLLYEHPAVYRDARIHFQHTEDLAAKIYTTSLLHINSSKLFEPFHWLLLGEIDPGLAIVELVSNHHLRRRIYQLSSPREHVSPPFSLATCICCSYYK